MPIRREFRKYYGSEWAAYRQLVLSIAGWKCTVCGKRRDRYLNLAHVTHDPRQMALVAAMCPSCHAKHDAPHAIAMRRRTHARKVGQLWLLEDLEWDPFPAWVVPRKVIAARQSSLFES